MNEVVMDAMQIANSPVMWVACALPVLLVVIQAILFAKDAYSAGQKIGLTKEQMNRAVKSSAITSIGPSIVVLSGMLSLLVAVGAPVGWMRLSMIGSVMFESIAAGIGTSAVGVALGADTLTPVALAMAVWTMILCSIGWVLFGTFAANRMDRIQQKMAGANAKKMMAMAGAAVVGVFTAMLGNYFSRPIYSLIKKAPANVMASAYRNAFACLLGAAIMFIVLSIAEKKNIHWLKEWALVITIILAMGITAIL